ncbi:hypothetical protein LCGC14_1140930 [marine sediment metagenome]|uniref:Uncharacterized protein n=1 Tax=marine sediment metagenome TaxID=412755 RepID=A0A0F9M337_9ZZZZ
MAKQTNYEASVTYDAEPISLLDRNILRIAKNYDGSVCGDSFQFELDRQRRKLAYRFATKGKARRFIVAMQKFLDSSDFGVATTVAIVPE